MKMNRDVLAGMVLDYKERFNSNLSAMNDELNELKTDYWSQRKRKTHSAVCFGRKKMLGKLTMNAFIKCL